MSDRTSWLEDLQYVDTHCHVDLFPEPTAIMREAREAQVGVVAVTNTPSVFQPMQRLAATFANVAVALGLHPELAVERETELGLVPGLVMQTPFIGEVGLDGTLRDERVRTSQERVLRSMVAYAKVAGPKVLTVHTRSAVNPAFEALTGALGSVILHWFSGTPVQAKVAVTRGWWFSANPAMLVSAKGRALIESLPPHLVLTETDGPFATRDGRPCRPADVRVVVDHLAMVWGTSHEQARARVMDNLRRCLAAQ